VFHFETFNLIHIGFIPFRFPPLFLQLCFFSTCATPLVRPLPQRPQTHPAFAHLFKAFPPPPRRLPNFLLIRVPEAEAKALFPSTSPPPFIPSLLENLPFPLSVSTPFLPPLPAAPIIPVTAFPLFYNFLDVSLLGPPPRPGTCCFSLPVPCLKTGFGSELTFFLRFFLPPPDGLPKQSSRLIVPSR